MRGGDGFAALHGVTPSSLRRDDSLVTSVKVGVRTQRSQWIPACAGMTTWPPQMDDAMPFDPSTIPMPDLGALCRICGYPLVGLGAHRCPECGWQFSLGDLIPPGEWPIVQLYGQPVPVTQAVCAILNIEGIAFEDNIIHALWGVNVGRTPATWLRVDRSVYFDAVHALLEALAGRRPVDANESKRDTPLRRKPWPCAVCGERNPGNFELCWQCQTPGNNAEPPTQA